MEKKSIDRLILLIVVLLLIIVIELIILFCNSKVNFSNGKTNKEVSKTQENLKLLEDRNNNDESGFTEIMGYGEIKVNKDYPYIYLSNSENNGVFLSYDIFCDDKKLYSSELISPGKMETFDIYSCLDAGKHTLIYNINSYDLETHEAYWSGIKQEQEIFIEK